MRFGPDAELVAELPGESAPDAAVIDKALGALERRGRINAAFFARMTAERMGKSAAIAAVAALWGEAEQAKGDSFRAQSDLALYIRAPDTYSSREWWAWGSAGGSVGIAGIVAAIIVAQCGGG